MDKNDVSMNSYYRNNNFEKEIMETIARIMEEQILKDVKWSEYIGISFDESTDVSSESHLVLCVHYIKEAKITSHFARIFDLDNQTADHIFLKVKGFLQKHGLIAELTAVSTDGCPAMISSLKGVYSQLR